MQEKILFIEAIGGLAGDMLCAALIDLGLDEVAWKQELAKLQLENATITSKKVMRSVFQATHLQISPKKNAWKLQTSVQTQAHNHSHSHSHNHDHNHDHGHNHSHNHSHTLDLHPISWDTHHRGFTDIADLLQQANLSPKATEMAIKVFHTLGLAEASIHGTTLEDVHFHEVGAVDSILDITGFCVGIEILGIDKILIGAVPLSHGEIYTEHGRTPLPAPATLRILQNWECKQGHPNHEQVTPTGAAIIATLAEQRANFPAMKIQSTGYGAGTRNPPEYPNIVRCTLGYIRTESIVTSPSTNSPYLHDSIVEIESNLDDMHPEHIATLLDILLEKGALDAYLQPIHMKKGRLGYLCTVLCNPSDLEHIAEILFTHSTTFGIRYTEKKRLMLHRKKVSIATEFGEAQIKLGFIGNKEVQCSVEFASALQLATAHNIPLAQMYQIILHRYHTTSSTNATT